MTSALPTVPPVPAGVPSDGPPDERTGRRPDGLAAAAGAALAELRRTRPLVQCLTNEVTTNLVANAVLAIGATPAMASVPGEAEQLAGVAGAVLVNLGTPGPDQRACIETTVATAVRAGVPWVLDPVAVGVLSVRTALAERLLTAGPAVVRGNASEILALAGLESRGRGVDAHDGVDAAQDAARAVAAVTGGAVAVSGPVDLVVGGGALVRLPGGDALLASITGAGCVLGALVAAFAAVAGPLTTAVGASAAMAVAAERAAVGARGPASFQVALLDELYRLEPDDLTTACARALAAGAAVADTPVHA
jgi:hydroxyethylthiazole kinase